MPTVGECSECGHGVDEDGWSTDGCSDSPETCETCHYAECDGSC